MLVKEQKIVSTAAIIQSTANISQVNKYRQSSIYGSGLIELFFSSFMHDFEGNQEYRMKGQQREKLRDIYIYVIEL